MMKREITIAGVVLAGTLALAGPATLAQQPPAGGGQKPAEPAAGQPPQGEGRGQGRGQGRGGGGGGPQTAPLNVEDRSGFESIFDGTMKNWDGDPAYWKAEGGSLVGVSTAENPVKENTFLIWRGGEPADFELKLDFKMNSTNSGIQFRSQHVPPGGEGRGAVAGKWVLKGYQADIDFNNQFTGMVYEERGRMFLTQRQAVYIAPDGSKQVIGNLERNADELKGLVKPGEWNSVHLIARGNTIINIVNGHVMTIIVDDDAKGRAMKGLIGFQIHTGPPMRIEYKNIYLKKL
jgi:hypothetical protein